MKKNIITNWLNRSRKLGLANINIVILILLSLIATATEIFGVGMFLPIFQFMRLEGDINAVVLDSTIWKYLIDVFIFFNIKPTFVFMLLMSFGFFLARQIFIYFGAVYNVAVKQRVTQYLRNKMFSKYLDADTLYHDITPVGDLVSILTVETSMAVSGIMAPLELIVSFVVLSAYLFVLSLLSWEMTLASIGILLVASRIHTQRLKNLGITISMDGKGRATDNICIERFWRSAKCERIYLNAYQSIGELITDVDDYIEFYNHRRFHETLDYKKPMDVYQKSIKLNQNKKKAS